MPLLTFAFCTYNRADRLPRLVAAMRAQSCPVPFEILAVNNNRSDDTAQVLAELAVQLGPPLRWVTEPVQGIVAARNRGIAEALNSDILVYIDDAEIPLPGLTHAAADAILKEGAESVGGCVEMDFTTVPRPHRGWGTSCWASWPPLTTAWSRSGSKTRVRRSGRPTSPTTCACFAKTRGCASTSASTASAMSSGVGRTP